MMSKPFISQGFIGDSPAEKQSGRGFYFRREDLGRASGLCQDCRRIDDTFFPDGIYLPLARPAGPDRAGTGCAIAFIDAFDTEPIPLLDPGFAFERGESRGG
ncbi:MAG: hypothetical protein KF802_07175 [Bdellovibrionaceae bacterium]|nr:hypothetical protein [Pseudobdellovibrionaceae bacterium]MBX3033047.1 hypothetical protein [Pseudobdellovibrionaceae bacterium]